MAPICNVFVCTVLLLLGVEVVKAATCTNPRSGQYHGPTSLYGFGLNWAGQLGFTNNQTYTPQRLFAGSYTTISVSRIRGGFQHSVVLDDATGTLFTAGDATNGALGLGPQVTTQFVTSFNQVVQAVEDVYPISIRFSRVLDVSCGWYHTCMVVDRPGGAKVFCSGKNDQGQLGYPQVTTSISTMLRVQGPTNFTSLNITNVTCGADHTVALASDGTVWAWGSGEAGQLGNGGTQSSQTPVQVLLPSTLVVRSIACGYRYCVVLGNDGSLWGWGSNNVNQLTSAFPSTGVSTPARILSSGVVQVAAGGYHVLVVQSDAHLYSWGLATLGQTSQPKPFPDVVKKQWNQATPTLVSALSSVNIQDVSAGIKHSIVLDTCGNVYTFGSDAFGQLGVGFVGISYMFRSMIPLNVPRVQQWQLQVSNVVTVGHHSFIIAQGS